MLYSFLAGHFQVVVAAKADMMVLLEVLDVQDHTTLVTTCPQPLAPVYWFAGCFIRILNTQVAARPNRDWAIHNVHAIIGTIALCTWLVAYVAAALRRGQQAVAW